MCAVAPGPGLLRLLPLVPAPRAVHVLVHSAATYAAPSAGEVLLVASPSAAATPVPSPVAPAALLVVAVALLVLLAATHLLIVHVALVVHRSWSDWTLSALYGITCYFCSNVLRDGLKIEPWLLPVINSNSAELTG